MLKNNGCLISLPVGQDDTFRAWEVILAKRDDAGEWATFGEPVPDARFDEMSVAHGYAEVRNKRDFGWRFDWARNPAKAWLAIREGHRGALRLHQPAQAPAEMVMDDAVDHPEPCREPTSVYQPSPDARFDTMALAHETLKTATTG